MLKEHRLNDRFNQMRQICVTLIVIESVILMLGLGGITLVIATELRFISAFALVYQWLAIAVCIGLAIGVCLIKERELACLQNALEARDCGDIKSASVVLSYSVLLDRLYQESSEEQLLSLLKPNLRKPGDAPQLVQILARRLCKFHEHGKSLRS